MPRKHGGYTPVDTQGRPRAQDAEAVCDWRRENNASISQTARHFGIGKATVKRYAADVARGMSPRHGKEFRTDPKDAMTKSTCPDRGVPCNCANMGLLLCAPRKPERSQRRPAPSLTPTSPNQADGGGLRFNEGKRDFTLIPPDALAYLADLFTIGARKYAPRNWERGMKYSNIMKSLDRHWNAFKSGEDHDEESKLYHMVHVTWNAMALLTYQLRGIGEDDRFKVPLPPTPDYDAMAKPRA